MKAYSSYILSTLFLLCGCSSEIAEEADKLIEKPVPILINSPRQIDVETKTVVDAFTTENISYVKIYGKAGTDSQYLDGLSPTPGSLNTQLNFDSPIIYPTDGSYVTLYSFYPSYVQDYTPSTTQNEVAITITGHEDLMYAKQEAGNRSNPTPVTFTFNHKLAQIKFKLNNCLISDTLVTDDVTIIANGPSSATMSLTSGNLTEPTGTRSFELPTNLTFNDLSKDTSSPTEIDGELLLFPNSAYSFSLKVGNSYYAVTFNGTTTTSWEASLIYTLTISINSLDKPLTDAPI